jgi:sarcosine oxidase subunit gamma
VSAAAPPRSFIAGRALTLVERMPAAQVNLRGDAQDPRFTAAVQLCAGTALPLTANKWTHANGMTALWLGPDEWLLSGEREAGADLTQRLQLALADSHAAVTDVSDARCVLRIGGARARDLLAKGCSLDLHERAFAADACAQTLLAKASVILQHVDGGFDVYVAGSFADYLWAWLTDAAREFWVQAGVAGCGGNPAA